GRGIAQGTQRGTQTASLLTRGTEAAEGLKAARRGSIGLKIGGKEVAKSEKLYDVASKLASPLSKSDTLQAAGKALSLKRLLPGGLADKLRGLQQSGVANVMKHEQVLRDAGLHNLTAEEARDI